MSFLMSAPMNMSESIECLVLQAAKTRQAPKSKLFPLNATNWEPPVLENAHHARIILFGWFSEQNCSQSVGCSIECREAGPTFSVWDQFSWHKDWKRDSNRLHTSWRGFRAILSMWHWLVWRYPAHEVHWWLYSDANPWFSLLALV